MTSPVPLPLLSPILYHALPSLSSGDSGFFSCRREGQKINPQPHCQFLFYQYALLTLGHVIYQVANDEMPKFVRHNLL